MRRMISLTDRPATRLNYGQSNAESQTGKACRRRGKAATGRHFERGRPHGKYWWTARGIELATSALRSLRVNARDLLDTIDVTTKPKEQAPAVRDAHSSARSFIVLLRGGAQFWAPFFSPHRKVLWPASATSESCCDSDLTRQPEQGRVRDTLTSTVHSALLGAL